MLQTVVVPQIDRWAHGSTPTLPLGRPLSRMGYDLICTVPPYESLASIEPETGALHAYHGARGRMVPDANMALIVIKQNSAHVAYVREINMVLGAEHRRCFRASKAVIRRVDSPQPTAHAVLEEGQRQ